MMLNRCVYGLWLHVMGRQIIRLGKGLPVPEELLLPTGCAVVHRHNARTKTPLYKAALKAGG